MRHVDDARVRGERIGRGARGLVALAAGASLALAGAGAVRAAELEFDGTAWSRVAAPLGITPQLLYSLALVESRRPVGQGREAPWPWTLRTPTGGYWFDSLASARRGLRAVLERWPAKRIDVGAAQVNLGWHAERYDDPMRLLELEYNLRVAGEILAEGLASTDDPVIGVGRYHHWQHSHRVEAYGRRVWSNYRAITFGVPDPAARFAVTAAPVRESRSSRTTRQ